MTSMSTLEVEGVLSRPNYIQKVLGPSNNQEHLGQTDMDECCLIVHIISKFVL